MVHLPFLGYAARVVSWLGAIALIALTSKSIRHEWNDLVYVINAAFLLCGGSWLGDKISKKLLTNDQPQLNK